MKNILILCHDIPSKTVGATLPLFHLIKNLNNEYNLKLISFNSDKYDTNELKTCLNYQKSIKIPEYKNIKDQLKYTLKNMICVDNLKTHSFLNYYYKNSMNKLIQETIQKENIDLLITDLPMAFYVKKINIPSIIYAFDAVSNYNYNMYKKSETNLSKLYWYLNYIKMSHYENIYDNFNSCVVVNNKDKLLLEKKLSVPISVVPNGVDITYFKEKKENNLNETKLVFLGDMSTPPNNDAVKYFIDNIYQKLIKIKPIPFYIVGRNPSSYIQSLDKYPNITVTGSVKDVRKYLNKGTIFITPMISGTGIKNKILEAMSMNLPVISTSCGISGINAENNKEFLLADTPNEFIKSIVELIDNNDKLVNMGNNAQLFVKNNYSWTNSFKEIKKIIESLLT